jgi:hypothetical protein
MDRSVYRIQEGERFSARRYPEPRYRFDAPSGRYVVLYANDTEVATFNESYAEKRRRVPATDDERLDLDAGAGEDDLPAHDLRVAGEDLLRGVHLGPPRVSSRHLGYSNVPGHGTGER